MSKISATDIRVNNFVNPIGINGDTPEFSWRISGAVKQSAWQIRAAHSAEDLSAGNFIWDSGKVISDSMSAIPYGKGNLQSREYVCFQLSLWDENDVQGEWSDIHFFEAGLLSEKDWDAQYFGFPAGWAGAAIAFQKFEELKKEYKKLRLYVAGSCVPRGSPFRGESDEYGARRILYSAHCGQSSHRYGDRPENSNFPANQQHRRHFLRSPLSAEVCGKAVFWKYSSR